ncbi:MAG: DUF1152 domain-containing protein [Armatimonadetes bacterium]|nr:DUF1152 domain-containing protein [Armatimonadota bacterium]
MEFLPLPIFERLQSAQTILLAGAGGGYDIFAGLPLYFALKAQGKTVHLANLSFTAIHATNARKLSPALVRVTAKTEPELSYFPELHLSRWLTKQEGKSVPLYCIQRTGSKGIIQAYQKLVEHLGGVDAVVLVDGGTDSLMRGDEPQLGTPEEDLASLLAAEALDGVPSKSLVCLGFGIDVFHGVCHHYFLEAVAELTTQNAYLGAWSLLPHQPEVRQMADAYAYTRKHMQDSIVNSSILAAIEGRFGNWHETTRTEGSELYINPLMGLYWAFDLPAVVNRHLFIRELTDYDVWIELARGIFQRHLNVEKREWKHLPM